MKGPKVDEKIKEEMEIEIETMHLDDLLEQDL
jgi:hypothetical protein